MNGSRGAGEGLCAHGGERQGNVNQNEKNGGRLFNGAGKMKSRRAKISLF